MATNNHIDSAQASLKTSLASPITPTTLQNPHHLKTIGQLQLHMVQRTKKDKFQCIENLYNKLMTQAIVNISPIEEGYLKCNVSIAKSVFGITRASVPSVVLVNHAMETLVALEID